MNENDESNESNESNAAPGWSRPMFEPRTYRELAYLLASLLFGLLGFVSVVVTLAIGAALAVTLLGLPILAAALAGARWLGRVHRALARRLLGVEVEEPAPLERDPGFIGWLRAMLFDPVAWRSVLYLLILFPLSLVNFVVGLVFSVLALFLVPVFFATGWVVRGLAEANRAAVRGLLGPVTLSERIRRLQMSRQSAVDTAAGDLRRIERDLHDGAQARLVSLSMGLGMATEKIGTGANPDEARELVAKAHEEAKRALAELRNLARGIYPAVLTDRGLDAALSSAVARSPVPVNLDVDIPERPPPSIEATAYFVATELLTNAVKHARASRVWLSVWRTDERLLLRVIDDGVGGADPGQGSGLRGLAERARAVDGTMAVDSPPGGPTRIQVELPCAS